MGQIVPYLLPVVIARVSVVDFRTKPQNRELADSLELVPGKLFAVLSLLPWTYTTYFPLQVYLGRVTPTQAAQGLGMQAFWIAALVGIAALMWRRGLRRYEAVGG